MMCEDYPCCGHELGDCDGSLYGSDEDIILRLTPHEIWQLEDALDSEPQVIPQLEAMIRRFGVDTKDQQRA